MIDQVRTYPVKPTTKGPSFSGVPSFDILVPIVRSAARKLSKEGTVWGRGVYWSRVRVIEVERNAAYEKGGSYADFKVRMGHG